MVKDSICHSTDGVTALKKSISCPHQCKCHSKYCAEILPRETISEMHQSECQRVPHKGIFGVSFIRV